MTAIIISQFFVMNELYANYLFLCKKKSRAGPGGPNIHKCFQQNSASVCPDLLSDVGVILCGFSE